jgi:uncharacterized damage-inducible protein DinB
MYRKIEDFERDWAEESESTLKVLRNLTDASLAQRVSPEGRTAGRLAWHLAVAITTMAEQAGLKGLEGPVGGDTVPVPDSAAEIAATYEAAARSVADAVRSQWRDEDLTAQIPMYGFMWTKGKTLSVLIRHEVHHRGQLTVLMRQAGLAVPGCYGPAREEWEAFGMPVRQ